MKSDKFIGFITLAFAGFMYYQAHQLPPPMFGTLGADFFPKILAILLALAGAALLIGSLRREKAPGAAPAPVGTPSRTGAARQRFGEGLAYYKFVIIGFVSFLIYVGLMDFLGYIIASLLFMPVLMWILGPRTRRSAAVIAATALGMTFGIYYSFSHLLQVYLPEGLLF